MLANRFRLEQRPLAALFVLAITLLCIAPSACIHSRDRRLAEDLYRQGDLDGARRVYSRLVDEASDAEDCTRLAAVEHDLSELAYEKALAYLAEELVVAALNEATMAHFLDPGNVPALFLAARLDEALRAESIWESSLTAAVDESRWEDALSLLQVEADSFLPHAMQGRAIEFFARAWSALAAEFDDAEEAGDVLRMDALRKRAEILAAHNGDLAFAAGVAAGSDMECFARRASDRAAAQALGDRAVELRRRALHGEARDALAQAFFLAPYDSVIREEFMKQHAIHLDDLRARLEVAKAERNWGEALRVAEAWEVFGQPSESLGGTSLEELRRRHAEQLQTQAETFERRGLPGNALVALLQAVAAGAARSSLDPEIVRLRDVLMATPLVRSTGAPDSLPPDSGRRFDGVTVLVGEATFRTERRARANDRKGIMVHATSEWRENPAFTAEERRLRIARERADRLHQDWCSADEPSRARIETQYRAATEESARCEARLRVLPPRERRSAWRHELIAAETIDLTIHAEMQVVIVDFDGSRSEKTIAADLRLEDRVAPADTRRGLPADPEEFPPEAEQRARLDAECKERLDALIAELRSDELRRLAPRAARCFAAGQVAEGLELAVRALLEDSDPLTPSFRSAFKEIEQWNPRGAAALRLWIAPPPAAETDLDQ